MEFALLLPLMVGILALAGDFGRAFSAYIIVGSAAREGAIYGSQSLIKSADSAAINTAARNATGNGGNIWGDSISVSRSSCADPVNPVTYRCVSVTVNYTFDPLLGIWPLDDSYPMRRTVQMRVIS